MSRIVFVLRLVLFIASYALVIAAVIAAPANFEGIAALAAQGAQYSLAFFLLPNAVSFWICAIFFRHRWARLRSPQILAAGFSTAIVTVALTFAVNALLEPLLGGSGQTTKWASRGILILPGILAAQLFWLGKARHAELRSLKSG